jgi:hypothetical protein
MANKVHTSLTFIKLARKENEVLESAALGVIIARLMKLINVNYKIVKRINLESIN